MISPFFKEKGSLTRAKNTETVTDNKKSNANVLNALRSEDESEPSVSPMFMGQKGSPLKNVRYDSTRTINGKNNGTDLKDISNDSDEPPTDNDTERPTISPMYFGSDDNAESQTGDQGQKNIDEPETEKPPKDQKLNLYHAIHLSTPWLCACIILHLLLFGFLLSIGQDALSPSSLSILLLLVVTVPVLLFLSRWHTTKTRVSKGWLSKADTSPKSETDNVPDKCIYLLSGAALLEGLACALYPVLSVQTRGNNDDADALEGGGFRSYKTLGQILSFVSLTLYAFYSTLRPANRLDPLRTILELEAVSLCWDALDGASLYDLLIDSTSSSTDDYEISSAVDASARFLMTFWYLSIGVRVTIMYCVHLSPDSWIHSFLHSPPLSLSPMPTVDRTLSAIRLKSASTMCMACAQFYAAGLRISLWSSGDLSHLQQEMMVKNILFLLPVGTAVLWRQSTSNLDWNARELFVGKIPLLNIDVDIRKPTRPTQLEILRYTFVVSYVVTGCLLSAVLMQVTGGGLLWSINIVTDVALCVVFIRLCKSVHKTRVWVLFPSKLASGLGIALMLNLFAARVPALYWHANEMEDNDIWNYTNALLIVLASLVPISTYTMFWSICNMLFHADFTACPGHYNAISDPGNLLVISQTMLEGALDVVSSVSLLSLADTDNIPLSLDGLIIFFAFFELCNACQSFMFLVQMSGGTNDTPGHLVKWRSTVRLFSGVIDFGIFILRLALWIQYNATDSVFLVKNLCSLIQTVSLVERARGVEFYTPNELFVRYVLPREWYGIKSEEEWKKAIEIPIDY